MPSVIIITDRLRVFGIKTSANVNLALFRWVLRKQEIA